MSRSSALARKEGKSALEACHTGSEVRRDQCGCSDELRREGEIGRGQLIQSLALC